MNYEQFLKSKIIVSEDFGFEPQPLSPKLHLHQPIIVEWALKGGRRAIFASFGLGKTFMQLEIARQCILKENKPFLIVCPLGVVGEFKRDNNKLETGYEIEYITDTNEIDNYKNKIYITNYERVRKGDIDPSKFSGVSFDEASILRNLKTETTNYVLDYFRRIPYRFVATATPTPNDYIEILNYAEYLGVADRGHLLTRFFKRDSQKAGNLKLLENKKDEFWKWVATWAVFITKPHDLGFPDEGYDLPPLNIIEHRIDLTSDDYSVNKFGKLQFFKDTTKSLVDVSREKRDSMPFRIAKSLQILEENPGENFTLWHHLESERDMLEKELKGQDFRSVYGSQPNERKEKNIIDFSNGEYQYLITKPTIAGSGCNLQEHCNNCVFVGIDYKFNDFIQSIHRFYRFGQTKPVNVHIIYTNNEDEVYSALMRKWEQHKELQAEMIALVKEYGLNSELIKSQMERQIFKGGKKIQIGDATLYNNDTAIVHNDQNEIPDNSVGMILTSIPFGDHYEYSDNYNDFGHNDGNDKFFRQMEYLTPNLLRVLKPGRVAAIHVKDRPRYSHQTDVQFFTIDPFSDATVRHFTKQKVKDQIEFWESITAEDEIPSAVKEKRIAELRADYEDRFYYMGRITVTTDVVQENNQTYRLGWSEQRKDASKMGVGIPEYILLFRKKPSHTKNAYADDPVTKEIQDYLLSLWQLDAHSYWKSSGDRFLTSDELKKYDMGQIYRSWQRYNSQSIYDFKEHLKISEELDEMGKLSKLFMTLPPVSNQDMVWTDISRLKTLNAKQVSSKKEKHICLAEGSLILTKRGYFPIQDIIVGIDETLTHTGQWKKIIAKELTQKNAQIIQVKAQGVPNLKVTPTHKLWGRKHKGYRPSQTFQQYPPDWLEAQELKTQYVNQKLPPILDSDLTHLDCWIIGRWLADGHIDFRGHQYFISVGKSKMSDFENKCFAYIGAKNDKGSSVQIGLKELPKNVRDILSRCGKGAQNKVLPVELISLDAERSQKLVEGYLSGDGHIDKCGNWHFSSVSRALLLGFSLVIQRGYGLIPSVYAGKKEGKYNIEGREVNQKQCWVLGVKPNGKHTFGKILDDGAWKRVSDVVAAGTSDVWNIRVEDDASYTAEGCIVKNCPLQLDIIERLITRFTNPGDLVDDPFGGLFSTAYEALRLGRKAVSVELNSEYFADGVDYVNAINHKINMPTLFDMLEPA